MTVAEDSHVAMYLVAYDDDATLVADVCKALQCLPVPADACGVVGIRENEHAAFLVGYLFQLVESLEQPTAIAAAAIILIIFLIS